MISISCADLKAVLLESKRFVALDDIRDFRLAAHYGAYMTIRISEAADCDVVCHVVTSIIGIGLSDQSA